MFDSKHYVPILKWKAAESRALEHLSQGEKSFMTPFLQIVMPVPAKKKKSGTEKTSAELLAEAIELLKTRLSTIPENIVKSWGSAPAYVDVNLVDASLRKEVLLSILKNGRRLGASFIPAVGLNTDAVLQKAAVSYVLTNKSELCLRLSYNDCLDKAILFEKTQTFLRASSLSANVIHLLIDYQNNPCPDFANLCSRIPNLQEWCTLTFANGAFPEDLTSFKVGEENYTDRSDWNNWVKQIESGKLVRPPSFGDYTIQHPIYKEVAQFFSPSASIRYTLKDKWLILRGQKKKSVQYLAHARMLSQDPKFRGIFFGPAFSYGDQIIAEKGKVLDGKTGNSTTWLVVGINHHLACTLSQIANLT